MLTDANGVGRGKIIRRHELTGLYEGGRHLPISILGLDITGEDVHETGLIWDSGDGDLRGWPIPGTLVPLHGTQPPRGQVLMSMYHLDGAPMTSDPRHALARQVDVLPRRACIRPAPSSSNSSCSPTSATPTAACSRPRAVLDGRRAARPRSIRSTICTAWSRCFPTSTPRPRLQGIPAETVISEYAPGQYELTLNYRKDVMRAADDLVMLKRLVRAQARRHGVTACFMAKPIEKYAGSGMHFHVSLQDDAGRNVFAESRRRKLVARRCCRRSAGLSHTMAESMLVFAPHANSWRRFVSQSYAPMAPTWGVNNRSVALRVPAGDAKNRRIEHRPSGVDANPYLVAATVLAGIAKGLDEKLDPGPETTGNGYESGQARARHACRPTGARRSRRRRRRSS